MLQRLASLVQGAVHQQQTQHVLLPVLQQLQQQHVLVQEAVQASTPSSASSLKPSSTSSTATFWQLQSASYSQRATKLNPKERKAQSKTDKKALKKSAVPQSTASAGDSATSFEDDMQTVEADVTRLVLQVGPRYHGCTHHAQVQPVYLRLLHTMH